MPQPTSTDVHVDSILTSISVAYIQQQDRFIADQVFPSIMVDKKSDKFFTYDKGDWFRDEAQIRAPGTESAGSGFNIDTDNYSCEVYAFHKDIDDQTLANADVPLNPRREAAEFVAQRMLLRREIDWASSFFTTSLWTGTTSGSDVSSGMDWDSNGDPIATIDTYRSQMLSKTGLAPNTLVLGYEAFGHLKTNSLIVDRFKYTQSRVVTTDLLAALFDLDRVLVSTAVKNSGQEGAADSIGFVATAKDALLLHVPASPGLLTPSAGYTFKWRGVSDSLGAPIGTSTIPMRHLRAERVESQMAWDSKVVATDLGVYLDDVTA